MRGFDSGALTLIFAHAPLGEVSLRYEALVMDDKVCPSVRCCWTDPRRLWRSDRRMRGLAR